MFFTMKEMIHKRLLAETQEQRVKSKLYRPEKVSKIDVIFPMILIYSEKKYAIKLCHNKKILKFNSNWKMVNFTCLKNKGVQIHILGNIT